MAENLTAPWAADYFVETDYTTVGLELPAWAKAYEENLMSGTDQLGEIAYLSDIFDLGQVQVFLIRHVLLQPG